MPLPVLGFRVPLWELGSGGCHTHVTFWLDRLLFAPIAILCAPIRFVGVR